MYTIRSLPNTSSDGSQESLLSRNDPVSDKAVRFGNYHFILVSQHDLPVSNVC